jgi:hypothetical protein
MAEVIHTHKGRRFRVNFWMGGLYYRHYFRYHAKTKVALAPEPVGHLSHVAGTVTVPAEFKIGLQKPRENGDSLVPIYLYEAETLKPGVDIGQAGRAVLDLAASHIVKPVDTPFSSMGTITKQGKSWNTAAVWNRGRTFGGGRGLKGL